jgi:Sulfotransferase domain
VLKRIIAGTKLALGLHRPGRNLVVLPDDVFIVSYPKSGNTWTRFLIGNLIHPQSPADFSNINLIIPDPEGLSKRQLARMPRPRYIKSHQYFDPRYQKVIYVVRDPRDVALSQYHFHRKRKLLHDGASVGQFISRFVAGKTSPYASWGENVASWMSTRNGHPGFLLLRYEDMIENTARELAKVADFLDLEVSHEQLGQAIARSSVHEMRRLEQKQALLWSSTKETRQDVPFVRTATPGGWKTEIPEASVREIEGAWAELMRSLGYQLRFDTQHTRTGSKDSDPLLSGILR